LHAFFSQRIMNHQKKYFIVFVVHWFVISFPDVQKVECGNPPWLKMPLKREQRSKRKTLSFYETVVPRAVKCDHIFRIKKWHEIQFLL
jgi:hypothetical protein